MTASAAGRLAWSLCILSVLLAAGANLLASLASPAPIPEALRFGWWQRLLPASAVAYGVLGVLIVSRRQGNPIGWLSCVGGFLFNLNVFEEGYAAFTSLPGAQGMLWLAAWGWYAPSTLLLAVLPLVFPDGSLPSNRWWWKVALWGSLAIIPVYCVGAALEPALYRYGTQNPLGTPAAWGFLRGVGDASSALQILFMLAGATALVVRFRGAGLELRQQLKWLISAVVLVAVVAAVGVGVGGAFKVAEYRAPVFDILIPLSSIGIPVAIGIAILRSHLYEIDLVINRAAVFGAMALFITAAYVAIVIGVGFVIGTGGRPNLALSLLAMTVAAVAFQPIRDRAQKVADRIVYGAKATPYEVLAEFSHWMAGAISIEEVLPRTAEAAARAAGANRSRVGIFLSGGGERTASWPAGADAMQFDRTVEVSHRGEVVGEIAVSKPAGQPLTAADEKLLTDLAAQAGLALRNVRLAAELAKRLEQIQIQAGELTASRTRIVKAEEVERRRIERNIHDGVQQEIVALIAKLRLARNQLLRDPEMAAATLTELQTAAQMALRDLRELARGIHPAVLEDRGLVEAIEARVGLLPIGVKIEAEPGLRDGRFAPDIEGAAYFLVSEGLTNALKHSGASRAVVRLAAAGTQLLVEVRDDGGGFDAGTTVLAGLRGLRDRIEALGGEFRVTSGPAGTVLTASLPARERQLA